MIPIKDSHDDIDCDEEATSRDIPEQPETSTTDAAANEPEEAGKATAINNDDKVDKENNDDDVDDDGEENDNGANSAGRSPLIAR